MKLLKRLRVPLLVMGFSDLYAWTLSTVREIRSRIWHTTFPIIPEVPGIVSIRGAVGILHIYGPSMAAVSATLFQRPWSFLQAES